MSEHDQQGGSTKPDDDDNKVGYCRPPKQHQFKKGQSGNPKGGSRKKARCLDDSRLDDLLQHEAARKVTLNGEEMRAEQALVRSIILNGIKGKVTPQRLAMQLLDKQEQREKEIKLETAALALEYKQFYADELKRLDGLGLPHPELPFHPDDVHINGFTGEVRIIEKPSESAARLQAYLAKLRASSDGKLAASREDSPPPPEAGSSLEPVTQSASAEDGNTS